MKTNPNRTAIEKFLEGDFTASQVNTAAKLLSKLSKDTAPEGFSFATHWEVRTVHGDYAHRWLLAKIAKARFNDDLDSQDFAPEDHLTFERLFREKGFTIVDLPRRKGK